MIFQTNHTGQPNQQIISQNISSISSFCSCSFQDQQTTINRVQFIEQKLQTKFTIELNYVANDTKQQQKQRV